MRRLATLLLLSLPLFAQNAALQTDPNPPFLDNNGKPVAGGKLYTCSAGTTCPGNPLATYTDITAGTPNANPVILDSTGRAAVYIGSSSYKFVLQNSLGVQIWVRDNVSSTAIATAGTLSASTGATLVKYTASGTGAVSRTVAAKFGDTVSVSDYSSFSTALTAASGRTLYVPNGSYSISSTLTIPSSTTIVCESGATINYTGTTDLFTTASLATGVVISGCTLNGSGAGASANAIHFLAAIGPLVENVKILGFANNDILNEGTETGAFRKLELDNAKYAIHNIGSAAASRGVNSNKFVDILIQNATTWAIYEDATGFGSNQKNVYDHITIENSGNDSTTSGHVFWQVCDSCEMRSSYVEYMSSVPLRHAIVLGDGTYTVKGAVFENNLLFGYGQPTFELTRTVGLTLTANADAGLPTYFLSINANSHGVTMRANSANSATGGFITGSDPGDLLTDSQTYTGVNSLGAAPFARGIGINQLTGMTQDLTLKTRVGGTNIVNFSGSGGGVGNLSDAGKLTVSGDITFHSGLFNLTGSPTGTRTITLPDYSGSPIYGFGGNAGSSGTTGSITSQSVGSGACVDTGALTIAGFNVGMAIVATPNADAGVWFVQKSIHTDATHFKIQECNMSSSSQTVGAVSFYVRIIQ